MQPGRSLSCASNTVDGPHPGSTYPGLGKTPGLPLPTASLRPSLSPLIRNPIRTSVHLDSDSLRPSSTATSSLWPCSVTPMLTSKQSQSLMRTLLYIPSAQMYTYRFRLRSRRLHSRRSSPQCCFRRLMVLADKSLSLLTEQRSQRFLIVPSGNPPEVQPRQQLFYAAGTLKIGR